MTLLEIFRNPGRLAEMTIPERLLGALQITVIGMSLTFIALVLVWLAARILSRSLRREPVRELRSNPLPRPAELEDDKEKVAAIAAVLALCGEGAPSRFRVKKIVRGPAAWPHWVDGGE